MARRTRTPAGATAAPQRIEDSYPKDRTELGGPRLGPLGWARWAWRQLTSMRTALFLLLLVALAAIPGSVFPQRPVDAARTRRWIDAHPVVAPWLDRLGFFDVYASPWFASIYLLLMISLVGCILPRMAQHARALRTPPPRTPSRLTRLPVHRSATLDATGAEVLAAARAELGRRRFRLRREEDGVLAVSAERGYLKEAGNLLFHLALLALVVSVAVGHLFGWKGEIIVKEGETFTSGAGSYDTLHLGPLVDEASIPVFSLHLRSLDVEFEAHAKGAQFGQPRVFQGSVDVTADGRTRTDRLAVNSPVQVDGAAVSMLGNGYAPVVTVRDGKGQVLFHDAVTFLPQDNTYSSKGAIKVVAADPELGLVGGFLPTITFSDAGPTSSFPGLVDPALVLTAFEGDLFPEGRPQSVFSVDTAGMTQLKQADGKPTRLLIRPGQSIDLPGGRGSVALDSVRRWAGLSVRHDPGRIPALLSAGAMLLGLVLMLGVRRRRVFVRVAPGEAGHTEVVVAGLPKGTDPGLEPLVEHVLARVVAATGGPPAPNPREKDRR